MSYSLGVCAFGSLGIEYSDYVVYGGLTYNIQGVKYKGVTAEIGSGDPNLSIWYGQRLDGWIRDRCRNNKTVYAKKDSFGKIKLLILNSIDTIDAIFDFQKLDCNLSEFPQAIGPPSENPYKTVVSTTSKSDAPVFTSPTSPQDVFSLLTGSTTSEKEESSKEPSNKLIGGILIAGILIVTGVYGYQEGWFGKVATR